MIARLLFAIALLIGASSLSFAQSLKDAPRYDIEALQKECGQSQDCRIQLKEIQKVENGMFEEGIPIEEKVKRLIQFRALTDRFLSDYPSVWRKVTYVRAQNI